MILSCPDDACGGNADGWGGRDGAAALTVGLIFCRLFDQAKSRKKCRLDLLVPFPSWEKERMDAVFDSSDCRDAAASVGGVLCIYPLYFYGRDESSPYNKNLYVRV